MRQAAERGDAGAMFKLSHMYDEGLGVKKSKAYALSWFNKGTECVLL